MHLTKIYIPDHDSVKLRSKEYVIGNDELLQWFDKEFEITNNNDAFVQVKDLYLSFKQSDIWNNLDKSEKRSTFNLVQELWGEHQEQHQVEEAVQRPEGMHGRWEEEECH